MGPREKKLGKVAPFSHKNERKQKNHEFSETGGPTKFFKTQRCFLT